MSRSSVDIRSATRDELPHAVAAIVAAFVADPPARFAWPSPHDYLQAMPVATRAFAGSCVEFGTAFVSTDLRGAALWLPPGAEADGKALDKVFRATVKREHLERRSRGWNSPIHESLTGTCRRSASIRLRKVEA
jgi:hypothetical protein